MNGQSTLTQRQPELPWKRGRLERRVYSNSTVEYVAVPPVFPRRLGNLPDDVKQALLLYGRSLRERLDELDTYLREHLLPEGAEPDTPLYRAKFLHFTVTDGEYRHVCDVLARRVPPTREDYARGAAWTKHQERATSKTVNPDDYWATKTTESVS